MMGDLANDAEAETQAGGFGEEVVAARSNEEVVAVPEEVVSADPPHGGIVDASGDVFDIDIAELHVGLACGLPNDRQKLRFQCRRLC